MTYVTACIDGSTCADAVADAAAWGSRRLQAPLRLLHVLDRRQYPVPGDLSGAIGLGSREHLLVQLAELDEQRGRLALEHGQQLLDAARTRSLAAGVPAPECRQRHGGLADTLRDLEGETRLLVIGRHGEDSAVGHVGSQLETVVRTLHRPMLIVPSVFEAPRGVLVAFDASPTAHKAIDLLASSPLLRELPIHLVAVQPNEASRAAMASAARTLEAAGHSVTQAVLEGDVEPALHGYQTKHGLNVLVMGAYGHSRIRQFLVGSTTSQMIRTSRSLLLLLR